jgi:hypothetical protein
MDNTKDMMSKGRWKGVEGEKQPTSILTETQVREIRTRYANGGISISKLALEYGVSRGAINGVVYLINWKHI